MTRAYEVSNDGDVISVGAGSYPPQNAPAGTKRVTFKGQPGNKIRALGNDASNVTFDGLDLDAGGTKQLAYYDGGTANTTFKNGRIGNVVDEKGALLAGRSSPMPAYLTFDNVEFHDIRQVGAEVHNECIFSQAPGLTIRNSTFTNCATMDLFVVRGSWWGQPPYGNVTLENNVFGHSVNGSGWHYYGLYWSNDAFTNNRVVNNTFENSVILDNIGEGPYSGVWANNIGAGWSCLQGVTYSGNVGKSCHSSDKAVPPENLPQNWVDPPRHDFHLKSTAAAIGAGNATHAPARDRDGKARVSAPDAGAYEYTG